MAMHGGRRTGHVGGTTELDRHMIDFQLVTPATLRQHWPRILSSLCAVRAKTDNDWIPEDVYHSIKSGESACHLARDGERYAGLLVSKISTAEFSGTRSLRSEEHTSELQSLMRIAYAVFCLKKK